MDELGGRYVAWMLGHPTGATMVWLATTIVLFLVLWALLPLTAAIVVGGLAIAIQAVMFVSMWMSRRATRPTD